MYEQYSDKELFDIAYSDNQDKKMRDEYHCRVVAKRYEHLNDEQLERERLKMHIRVMVGDVILFRSPDMRHRREISLELYRRKARAKGKAAPIDFSYDEKDVRGEKRIVKTPEEIEDSERIFGIYPVAEELRSEKFSDNPNSEKLKNLESEFTSQLDLLHDQKKRKDYEEILRGILEYPKPRRPGGHD
jgi:hypothetical protein